MPRIFLIGGNADLDLGPAATQHALCAALHGSQPSIRITTVSGLSDGPRPPGVSEVLPPGARHAKAQWRAARDHDLVVLSGEGLLQDGDGRMKVALSAARLAALHAANPIMAGHSLGTGNLENIESRMLASLACSYLRSISVSEEPSRRALQDCTPRPVYLVPDPAFMLEADTQEQARRLLEASGISAGRPLIGVAMRQFAKRRGPGKAHMPALLEQLAIAVTSLAAQHDAEVLLLPSNFSADDGDVAACDMLAARINVPACHVVCISSPRLYKAVTGELRLLISARTHPVMFAAGMGVPVLGIGCSNRKLVGCLDLLGIPDQCVSLDVLATKSGAERLEQRATIALASTEDLVSRAAELAKRSHTAATRLLDLLG
jgi:polysaccharide pyruvyl transferase WcaK-like protein